LAWYAYGPYVSVAEKRLRGQREIAKRVKKGLAVEAVTIIGRTIARTFWGKAWCEHLESYSDYANRLPRGRTYVRNGSVMHLSVRPGSVDALVQGSELYEVSVDITKLAAPRWKSVVRACAGKIDSLIEILQGKLSHGVMQIVTDRDRGLFPTPQQVKMECSCPDWAGMCKHVAAVLYGIGARFDQKPELLFALRGVDPLELLAASTKPRATARSARAATLAASDLGDLFGIQIAAPEPNVTSKPPKGRVAKPDVVRRSGTTRSVERNGKAGRGPARARKDSDAMVERIVQVLGRHKAGLRADQIRVELGVDALQLVRPITSALSSKRITKRGRRRATTYHAT
jgi:uncharacterized Zn finger protein